MADSGEKLSVDNGGTGGQAPPPYESVWMSHWRLTSHPSSSTSSRAWKNLVADQMSKENQKGKQPASVPNLEEESLRNAEELKEVRDSTKPVFLAASLNQNSDKLKKGQVNSFPIFSVAHKGENFLLPEGQATRTVLGENLNCQFDFESGRSGFPSDRSANSLPSGDNYFQPVGLAYHLGLSSKPHDCLERSSLATSTSTRNDAMQSRSELVSHGYNNSTRNSTLHGKQGITLANSNLQSREIVRSNNYCHSSHVHDKQTRCVLERRSSGILISGLKGAETDRVDDQHQTMNNSTLQFLKSCPVDGIDTEMFYVRSSPIPHLPSSMQDAKTMRIYTTIDSVGGSSRGHPRLSQTTHHLWITKRTNVNLFESGPFAGESKISTKFMGGAFKNLVNIFPAIGHYGQQGQGVKLLSLGCSVDSDKENVRDVKTSTTLKNEASAETSIMDINTLQENHHSGALSPSSNKCKDDQKSLAFRAATSSGAEGIKGQPLTLVADINQALLDIPTSTADDGDSTSRTQTLDVEHLLSNAEQITDSKSSSHPASSTGPDMGSRWIKRLKSVSDSAYGTKSLNLEDNSEERARKNFNKFTKTSKSSSDPKWSRYHGEERVVPVLHGELSSSNTTAKSQNIRLSHPWIMRWSHVQSASHQKKVEPVVVCGPENSNAVSEEELLKRQFPSLAAMALMVKAMNGFRQCKFTKKGSIVVWNTNGG